MKTNKNHHIAHFYLRYVGGGAEDAVTGIADAVVVVGDAEQLQPPSNGGLHDGFRGILPAE